jgi:hypothetical protein
MPKSALFALALGTVALWTPVDSAAQTAPLTRTVTLTFSGVVANDVAQSIEIRQPDGSYAPFTGPVPDYPYRQGDQVAISFNATLPTADFYTSSTYGGQTAADGIYRITLTGPNNASSSPLGLGNTSGHDVAGPIGEVLNAFQRLGLSGMTVVYDSKADTYALEYPSGAYIMSLFDGPGYAYDSRTGTLSSVGSTCAGGTATSCTVSGDGGFALRGDADSVTATGLTIWGPDTNFPETQARWGTFDLNFEGSWGFSSNGASSGGPVSVPEPGVALLFAFGTMMLARRRRQAAKSR